MLLVYLESGGPGRQLNLGNWAAVFGLEALESIENLH